MVLRADKQAVDDGHRNVELLEYLGLFLDFSCLDKLVQPFLGQYQCHQVLFDRVLIGDIMNVLHFFGIEADEPEVELFHAGNVPLQGFQYHLIAGRYVHRAAQALLCAYQYAVDGRVEFRHDVLPPFECHVSLDHKYRAVGKAFAEMVLVKVECGYRRAADSHFSGYLPHQFLYVLCLVRNPVSGVTLYQVWDGTGLDKQFDLPHEPESGILLRITRTVVIQLTDTAEFLDDDTVNLTLSVRRTDGMGLYLVFFSCEIPELACDDRLADKF